jgi:hypothetical protein
VVGDDERRAACVEAFEAPRGDRIVRRRSDAAPTRWIERIKPTRRPDGVPAGVRTAQLCCIAGEALAERLGLAEAVSAPRADETG